jgi:type I restriction enzyme S subunit
VHYCSSPCFPIDTTYYITNAQTDAHLPWLARRLGSLGLHQLNRAAAIPGLNRSDAYRLRLLLPPLVEQKRIATILDTVDALRTKRRESINLLDKLLQSTFLDMFGEPVTNPMEWPTEALGTAVLINPQLAASDRPGLNEKVSFVPMAALSEETLSIIIHNERPFSEVCRGYTPFKRGDVLVAKITPCFENGKMTATENLPHEFGFGSTEFHVFRPSKRVLGAYLFNLLCIPLVRKAGAMKMKGAAGQRRVPAEFFASLQIPLPPIDLQRRFAAIVESIERQKARQRAHIAEQDTLFASLQQRAFNGEL